MKTILTCILILTTGTATAQEIYFSISGKRVRVASGDSRGQYDIWLRPITDTASQSQITVDVYDAGLGGFTDLVYEANDTYTTFELYRFTQLYRLDGTRVKPLTDAEVPFQGITAGSESRYINRWVPFFQLPTDSPEGWVIRVTTDEGNDVNNFQIRLSGEAAQSWQIVSMNLSIGLVETAFSNRIYFKPLFGDTRPLVLKLAGQEETTIEFIDSFGRRAPSTQPWDGYVPAIRDIRNSWGIAMSGSTQRVNNLVVEGRDEIIPVIFEPQILTSDIIETPEVRVTPDRACLAYGLSIRHSGQGLDLANAKWYILNDVRTGKDITYTYPAYSAFGYDVIIPVVGRYFPRQVVLTGSVTVNQSPVIEVTGFKPIISPAERIVLDASKSHDPEGQEISFQWFVNGEVRSTEKAFTFSSLVSGRYVIRLLVTDNVPNASCSATERIEVVVVNSQPYAEIDFRQVIARATGETVSVVQDEDADRNPLAFRWQGPGVPPDATGRTVTVFHDQAGTFPIELTVDDQTGTRNATYTTRARYKVNAEPQPRFQLISPVAPGQPVPLDGSGSIDADGDPMTYQWTVSDGRRFNGPSHMIAFDKAGEYDITLTVDDGERVANSVQTLTRRLRVTATPVPVISSARVVQDSRVTFSAAESQGDEQVTLRYEWDFGDGNKAVGESVQNLYARPGTYAIRLTVDDGLNLPNSRQTTTSEIKVNANPVASMTHPPLVAPGQSFLLDGSASSDADGEIRRYEWAVNGVKAGEGRTFSTSIATPGTHAIRLTVYDDTGFESAYGVATSTIRVNHPPVVVWNSTPAVTEPNRMTTFTSVRSTDADNRTLTTVWEFEDGVRLEGETVARSFPNPGVVAFTIHVNDGEGLANSVASQPASIRVNQPPIVVTDRTIRSNTLQIPLDASRSYDPDGSSVRVTWILPDGSRRNESAFVWTAPRGGMHPISLLVDDGEGLGNSRVAQPVQVLVNRPPVAVVDSLLEACSGNLVIFSSARSYDPDGDLFTTTWDFGDGSISTENNPVHRYSEPGLYLVKLTLNDGFSAQPTVATIPVRIEGSPKAVIPFDEITVCANTPVTFDGTRSTDPNDRIGSYSWDFGDSKTGLGANATHVYTTPGVYNVILTVIGSGSGSCSNMSQTTARVIVVEGPEARFSVPAVVAPNEPLVLDASTSKAQGGIASARWTISRDGQTVASLDGISTRYVPDQPGTYRIRLDIRTSAGTACDTSVLESVVRVNAAPVITWNAPASVTQFEPVMLSAIGSSDPDGFIQDYIWRVDDVVIGSGLTVPLPTQLNGTRTLTLTVRDNAGVSNSVAVKETRFSVNAAPVASFTLPETVYQGEQVVLKPESATDDDGDVLTATWSVNGEPVPIPSFKAVQARYTIRLTQDDGKGLANSVSSATRELIVTQPVPVTLRVPTKVAANHALTPADLGLPAPYVLLSGSEEVAGWRAVDAGQGTIEYGWKPRGQVLARYSETVTVMEPLAFAVSELRLTQPWNPSNPFVQVSAPALNRSAADPVVWTWRQGTSTVSVGPSAQLRLVRGENRFELVAEDQGVTGSAAVRIPVMITTMD